MKVYKYIILLVLIFVPVLGFSQKWKLTRSSYTYGIGIVNYFGDIGGAQTADASPFADFDLNYTRPVFAVGYHYKVYERFAVKANLTYANIHGSDVKSVSEARNFSFTTNMLELNGQVEYHITKEMQMVRYKTMSLRDKVDKYNVAINVYLFAGLGGAYFKQKALDDLSDGPRSDEFNDSKNLALVIPVGIGFKYPLTRTTFIGLELGGRFTTTDFIDGVIPEGSDSKDLYYFTVINVSTKIEKRKRR